MERKMGIILNSIDYKENHKIIYLLTENGKESFMVSRAKRIKEGLLYDTQNLTLISFESTLGSLPKTKNIEVINYYNEIKNDLYKMTCASYTLELIYRMVESSDHYDVLYKLLLSFLDELTKRSDTKVLLLQFRIKMLYFLGIQPQFKMCCHCGNTTELVGLSVSHGGVECINHTSTDNIGITATKIIDLLYRDKTLNIKLDDESVVDLLSNIIDSYYEKHGFYGLKSKVMLEKLGCY